MPPPSFAVVPGGALCLHAPIAFEDPVTELTAHGEDLAEEAAIAQHGDLAQPRQEELVLDDTVLDAATLCRSRNRERLLQRLRDRLLAIDMLAGRNRLLKKLDAHLRRTGIEEDRIAGIGKSGLEIGRRLGQTVLAGNRLDLFGIASDKQRLRHQPIAVR